MRIVLCFEGEEEGKGAERGFDCEILPQEAPIGCDSTVVLSLGKRQRAI
jgi:hypothetical protein